MGRERLGIFSFVLVAVLACASPNPQAAFEAAVRDARVAEASEVRDDLVLITDENRELRWRDSGRKRFLLVASVVSQSVYEKFYGAPGTRGRAPDSRPLVWVTAVPELQQACRAWSLRGADLEMRIKQYLGLPPHQHYDRVLLLWVDRDRLLRPCTDPRTDAARCDIGGPEVVPDEASGASYREIYTDLLRSSQGDGAAPWTRLGYTYDWKPGSSHRGASEFILVPGTEWQILDAPSLETYCEPPP